MPTLRNQTRPHPQSDEVPESGPWQTDPEFQRLFQAAMSNSPSTQNASSTGSWMRGGQDPRAAQDAALAFRRYLEAPGARERLGIPANYWPDPRTNGMTLVDPNQNVWRNIAITGGSMAAGGYGLGALLGGAGAATAPAASTAAEGGLLPGISGEALGGMQTGLVAPSAVANGSVNGSLAAGGAASKIGSAAGMAGQGWNKTQLALAAMSLLGGDDSPFQERKSFTGTGADPVKNLSGVLDAIKKLGSQVSSRGPTKLRPIDVGTTRPVTIDGLPFQIGGGFGRDPAINTATLEEPTRPQPFDIFSQGTDQAQDRQAPTRQRKP